MNIPSSILTMLAGIALTLVSIWYGQHHNLMPVEASQDAVLVDGLFNTMMTVGTGIFLLVEGVILVCMFKFRRKPGDTTDGPPIEGNIPLEILWTAIPVVIVLFIAVYSFEVYRIEGGFDPEAADQTPVQIAMVGDSETATPLIAAPSMHSMHHHMALGVGATARESIDPPDLTINVMGLQYAWIFTYTDSGVTTGELHLPANKDIKLVIKAQDVLHAFWLPQFRLKQDAIPGQDAELRFTPSRVGDYPIVCAELCGPFHGGMISKLYVQEPEEFDAWLQQQVASQSSDQTVAQNAVRSESGSDAAYLTTLADHAGVDAEVLKQLQPVQPINSPVNASVNASVNATEQAAAQMQPAA